MADAAEAEIRDASGNPAKDLFAGAAGGIAQVLIGKHTSQAPISVLVLG